MAKYKDIFDAVKNGGTLEDVRHFVEQEGADVNGIDSSVNRSVTELAFVFSKNPELIKYLVSQGADIESHLIFDAIDLPSGSLEIVKLFVEQEGIDVDHRDSGMFPLLLAAGGNNLEVAQYLVSKGADITMRSGAGLTALELAQNKGHAEMVAFLSAQKKKPPIKAIVKTVLIVIGVALFLGACGACLGIF